MEYSNHNNREIGDCEKTIFSRYLTYLSEWSVPRSHFFQFNSGFGDRFGNCIYIKDRAVKRDET